MKKVSGTILMARILAIDYGKMRNGLAISDETKQIASGYKVVVGLDALKKEIKNITQIYDIEKVLIGISKKSNNELGEIGILSLEFVEYLKTKFDFDIELIDEAMTTKEVMRILREMNKPVKKHKDELDKFAAEIMLQEFLNNCKRKD
ncbi:MAG: Holliday junction resolvase RuvX [Elusimicrobiota bacterium]|jgi:putative Holliday junction resolvase|nr:Holliday junction resolvase RuvX [Elusimicrobiota bacterium]